jgi:hypothetical protein
MSIPPTSRPAAREILVAELRLRVGARVVARVASVDATGAGVLALAGRLLGARLPEGVRPGDRLGLRVVGLRDEALVLRLEHDGEPPGPDGPGRAPARLVSALAQSGDGELVRAALALAGGVLPLPGGRVAVVDEEPPSGGAEGVAGVTVVVHSPALGPLEIRLVLGGGRLDTRVEAEPGAAAALARAEAGALAGRLEAVTGAAVHVGVGARRASPPVAPPPPPLEGLERFA